MTDKTMCKAEGWEDWTEAEFFEGVILHPVPDARVDYAVEAGFLISAKQTPAGYWWGIHKDDYAEWKDKEVCKSYGFELGE